MSKTPISWIDLVKLKSDELKKAGNDGGLKEAIKKSKETWQEIKSGKHPKYIQGKPTKTRKGKKGKKEKKEKKEKQGKTSKITKKVKKNGCSVTVNINANDILENCKVCSNCVKKIEKYIKKNEKHEKHTDDDESSDEE